MDLGKNPKVYRKIKRKSKKHPIILTIITAFLIIAAASAVFISSGLNKMVVSGDKLPDNLDAPAPKRLNILLIGSDKGGYNTDTLILASWDKEDNQLKLCSIPRDTRVLVNGKIRKINSCMAIGGEKLLLQTIKDITGAPINYYVNVDTSGFKSIVDILGGVDFYVPQNMKYPDPAQGLYIDLKEGYQHLDGDKAEQLVRFRRYPQADIQRVKVQQDFLKALIKQNLNAELIVKAPALYSEISKYIKTNMSANQALKNVGILNALTPEKKDSNGGMANHYEKVRQESIVSYTLPGKPKTINGISYYLADPTEAYELMKKEFGGRGTSSMRSAYAEEYKKAVSSASEHKQSSKPSKNGETNIEPIKPPEPIEAPDIDNQPPVEPIPPVENPIEPPVIPEPVKPVPVPTPETVPNTVMPSQNY